MAERWAPPDTTVVTGAAGWLGQALIRRLVGDCRRVALRVNVLSAADRSAIVRHPKIEHVQVGDLSDPAVARALLAGLDPTAGDTDVIHTAGIIHPSRVTALHPANTVATRNVAAAALVAGVRRLVHISSNSPFGANAHPGDRFRADEPYHPYLGYGRSKMHAELAVLDAVERGLDATIVRPPWFYGPFQPARQTMLFRMVRAGRFPVFAGGHQRRSMVYIDNLVDGVVAAELTPAARGRGYWIADARPYELREIVETVGRALRDEGFTVASGMWRLPGMVSRAAETADRMIQRAGCYQQQLHVLGELGKTIACDISTSRSELGYVPRLELYEGMRRSIRWCVDNGVEL